MSTYASGGYTSYPNFGSTLKEVKTSHNVPKLSTVAIFKMLSRQPRNKITLQRQALLVNRGFDATNSSSCKNPNGYLSSTIAWHTREGRFSRTRIGNQSFFQLTQKGLEYAKQRGIL